MEQTRSKATAERFRGFDAGEGDCKTEVGRGEVLAASGGGEEPSEIPARAALRRSLLDVRESS